MNKLHSIISFVFLFLSVWVNAKDYPKFNNYINDYAGIISSQNENALNQKLTVFERQTGTQIVVLTVSSLDGNEINSYTNEVFSAWKIGQEEHDNGVLLLVSKGDRKLRIEVGYGLEGELTDGEAGRIIRNVILPRFKQGEFDLGIVQGVQTIQDEVQGFVGLPEESTDDSFYTFLKYGLFALFIFLVVVLWRKYQRYKPRRSKKTGERMTRLEEDEEDEFLIESEQHEEKIGSKDYDVWVTADRGDYEVISYNSTLSGYSTCPSCGTKAQKETSNKILQRATYSRSGEGVSVRTCSFCKHVVKDHYRIARKRRSSNTYRGGGFSGGGGGGFSGGGFSGGGGGFSGGGGASGSW